MKKPKFIYFDVGGVVLLDFSETEKWEELKSAMGVNEIDIGKFNKVWDKYEDRRYIYDIDWDVVVDSSVVKLQKNGPEIFKLAQKLCKIENPGEILFVDNSESKLVHAEKLGWQTFLYHPTQASESSAKLCDIIK